MGSGMSDAAEKAYDEALRRIETARENRRNRLSLAYLGDLTRIPPQIADLRQVTIIDLSWSKVTDLRPLAAMSWVHTVLMARSAVVDLTPLAKMQNLRALNLSRTMVSDLTPLSGLINLQHLILSGSRAHDISPLRDIITLVKLDIDGTQIKDIAMLRNFRNLRSLDFSNTDIGDLTPLANLSRLNSLYLSDSAVTDIKPLQGMKELRQLYLKNLSIRDFTPLSHLKGLRYLDLDGTSFPDLELITPLINLERLWLDSTPIQDIAPLKDLYELRHLDLDNTQVADLRPVLRLGKLGGEAHTSLSFAHTPFAISSWTTRRLSQSRYHKKRTRETLAYLKTLPPWPEPLVPDTAPEPAPESGVPLHWQAEKIALAVPVLGQDEADDPIRRTLFDALGDQVADLKRVSGNLDESAYRLACKLEDLLAQGYANMEPLRLHLVIEDLRRLQTQVRPEADRDYLLALAAVVETGPGLTLDTAAVTLFVDRARRNRLERLDEVQAETQIALAQAVAQSPLSAEDVATIATRAADARITDQFTAIRPTLTRNYVLVVATYVLATGFQGVIGNEAHQGFLWLVQNAESIRALAPTWGEPFLVWIIPILEKAQQVVMATDHAIRSRNEPE